LSDNDLSVKAEERPANWIYDATLVPWNAEMLSGLQRYGYVPGGDEDEWILPWTTLGQVCIALGDGTVTVEAADPDGSPFWRVVLKGNASPWCLMGVANEALSRISVKHNLRPNYSTVADSLAFAREWVISEEWI
jgi:hypothetical protein